MRLHCSGICGISSRAESSPRHSRLNLPYTFLKKQARHLSDIGRGGSAFIYAMAERRTDAQKRMIHIKKDLQSEIYRAGLFLLKFSETELRAKKSRYEKDSEGKYISLGLIYSCIAKSEIIFVCKANVTCSSGEAAPLTLKQSLYAFRFLSGSESDFPNGRSKSEQAKPRASV